MKKERESIFKLFVKNEKLKFNEIEKALKIRSNMVSYHLEQMRKDGMIEKINDYYLLTSGGEKYLPMLSHIVGEDLSPLPVVLAAIVNNGKILLIKRNKRPYKNYWSMIGGKILLDETIQDACVRIVKKKTNLNPKFVSTNSVLHERVIDDTVKHGFILFFTKVIVDDLDLNKSDYGDLEWFNIDEIDNLKIIPSDKWLLENKFDSSVDIISTTMNSDLKDFKILKS